MVSNLIVSISAISYLKKSPTFTMELCLWSHMGSNHGPPDYESGALTSWAIGPVHYKLKSQF